MSKNRFGLSKNIPENIKQKIRQNSKFGCVVPNCRNAFYEYEHIEPEFHDAKEHDPEKICLVCCNHNPRRTGNQGQENYSKEQISVFYKNLQSTLNVPIPVNNDFFYGFSSSPTIILGKNSFKLFNSIISIDGVNVLSFQKNQTDDIFAPPITFSGIFKDSLGSILFEISQNEWTSPTYHWDVVTQNGKISIWDKSKKLVFNAIKIPTKNIIEITHLDMWFSPFHVLIDNGNLTIGRFSNNRLNYIYLTVTGGEFIGGNIGLYLNSKELDDYPNWNGFSIIGGDGISLNENGINIGKGASNMIIKGIQIQPSKII